MSKLVVPILLALAACGRGASCPAVVDHAADVMHMDLSTDQRHDALARCEKATRAQRECIRDADTPIALRACDAKE